MLVDGVHVVRCVSQCCHLGVNANACEYVGVNANEDMRTAVPRMRQYAVLVIHVTCSQCLVDSPISNDEMERPEVSSVRERVCPDADVYDSVPTSVLNVAVAVEEDDHVDSDAYYERNVLRYLNDGGNPNGPHQWGHRVC